MIKKKYAALIILAAILAGVAIKAGGEPAEQDLCDQVQQMGNCGEWIE